MAARRALQQRSQHHLDAHRQAHDHADVEHGNCGHSARGGHVGKGSDVLRDVGVSDSGIERAIQNMILRGEDVQRSSSARSGQPVANDLRHRNDCPSEARLVPEVRALQRRRCCSAAGSLLISVACIAARFSLVGLQPPVSRIFVRTATRVGPLNPFIVASLYT